MSAPLHVYVVLAVGLVAASQSGNLVRVGGEVSAVAIVAWRLLLASVVLVPFGLRDTRVLVRLTRVEWGLLLLAAAMLAFHLLGWVSGVQRTTVANAAIVFAINPVFTAAGGWLFLRERVGSRLLLSVALGVAGVLVMGWRDLSLDPGRLAGDLQVLASSVAFSAYFLLGRRLRRVVPGALYVALLYGLASLPCFLLFPAVGLPWVDHGARAWLCFGLMALVPTVLGHGAMNYALRWVDAGRVSASTLMEPLLAGIVAFFAWDEAVGGATWVGYAFIVLSVVNLLLDEAARARTLRAEHRVDGGNAST